MLRSRKLWEGELTEAIPPGGIVPHKKRIYEQREKASPHTGKRGQVTQAEAGHARFLTMFEQSGLLSKSKFIAARIFNEEFRVIRTDRATMEYVVKLTELFRQFRAIGVNYNQAVKELHIHFTEKKALALLYRLEKLPLELVELNRRIVELSQKLGTSPPLSRRRALLSG